MTAPGTRPVPATGWWVKPNPAMSKTVPLSMALLDDNLGTGWIVAAASRSILSPALAFIVTL